MKEWSFVIDPSKPRNGGSNSIENSRIPIENFSTQNTKDYEQKIDKKYIYIQQD